MSSESRLRSSDFPEASQAKKSLISANKLVFTYRKDERLGEKKQLLANIQHKFPNIRKNNGILRNNSGNVKVGGGQQRPNFVDFEECWKVRLLSLS